MRLASTAGVPNARAIRESSWTSPLGELPANDSAARKRNADIGPPQMYAAGPVLLSGERTFPEAGRCLKREYNIFLRFRGGDGKSLFRERRDR